MNSPMNFCFDYNIYIKKKNDDYLPFKGDCLDETILV